MGFEADIKTIIEALDKRSNPAQRQNILLSATLTNKVESMASITLKEPLKIDAEESNMEKFSTPVSLKNFCVVVPYKLRLVTLTAFLLDKCKVYEFRALDVK